MVTTGILKLTNAYALTKLAQQIIHGIGHRAPANVMQIMLLKIHALKLRHGIPTPVSAVNVSLHLVVKTSSSTQ
jgi:hypothetical protein